MKTDFIIHAAIELVEQGWVPDWLIRRAIQRLCTRRLSSLNAGGKQDNSEHQRAFMEAARQSPIALVPEKANEQHYEVPAEFYQQVLGRRGKYSCCFWPEGVSTLDEAETAALQETCAHAQLEDGMQVLELGCGWGSLSLWIVENYPHCRVTAVSNSHSQRAFIEQQAAEQGVFDRLTVVTADMNDFSTADSIPVSTSAATPLGVRRTFQGRISLCTTFRFSRVANASSNCVPIARTTWTGNRPLRISSSATVVEGRWRLMMANCRGSCLMTRGSTREG